MSDIIDTHKAEAQQLALELYYVNKRREQLEERLSHIQLILKTAAEYEKAEVAVVGGSEGKQAGGAGGKKAVEDGGEKAGAGVTGDE